MPSNTMKKPDRARRMTVEYARKSEPAARQISGADILAAKRKRAAARKKRKAASGAEQNAMKARRENAKGQRK